MLLDLTVGPFEHQPLSEPACIEEVLGFAVTLVESTFQEVIE